MDPTLAVATPHVGGLAVKPTRWVPLLVCAAVGLAIGWLSVLLFDRASGRVLTVPWLAPGALWILALAVLIWAVVSRPSLVDPAAGQRGRVPAPVPAARPSAAVRNRKRMPPLVAARTAALALAASRTGAAIGGFYLGIALALIPRLSAPTASASFSAAIVSVVACLVLTAAAVWLESMCRLRDDDT